GRVELETEGGKPTPVSGALIDVYRLDSGGHWSGRTGKTGDYAVLGLPILGTYLIIASGPRMSFLWANKVVLKSLHLLDFVAMPGDGKRPTLKDVQARIAAGESRLAEYPTLNRDQVLVVKSVYKEADREKAFSARVELEVRSEEVARLQADLNRAAALYN